MSSRSLARAGGALIGAGAVAGLLNEKLGAPVNLNLFQSQESKDSRLAHAKCLSELNKPPTTPLPTRNDMVDALKSGGEFDVLIIGGGATGAGVVLDAQTRGLKAALVELDDFSSGTSSRSTKLIHGGVRYLQAAIMKGDIEQYKIVKEALFERANLLEIAPHLSSPLPIMLPLYKWWELPYYWIGIKAYDFVSGDRLLKSSYYIDKEQALERFPMLNTDSLKGALIYYDGQHNDARMNLALILTAIRHGAKCANHVKVERLNKNKDGKVIGAHLRDMISGVEWDVKAKSVVNATGPSTDSIRQMADKTTAPICAPSSGVHIVLPGYYSPSHTGLLQPDTSDGRVIFFLPWQGMTIAGTTDAACLVTLSPQPKEKEIEFILNEIRSYMSKDVSIRREDVMSAWSGLRPLVRDPKKNDTKSLARNHIVEVSDSGLVTIAGGKWTTYRHMAEETIDACVKEHKLQPKTGCMTPGLKLEGAHGWNSFSHIKLVQHYEVDADVAHHLATTYGNHAPEVIRLSKKGGERLHREFPYLKAEVRYAVREHASTAVDVIARRLRLAFLNTKVAHEVLPEVVSIMAEELNWSPAEQVAQFEKARTFIDLEMGHLAKTSAAGDVPAKERV